MSTNSKVIFITGATAGFGAAMVKRFVKENHFIIATGRRKERLEEIKKQWGPKVFTAVLDVRDKAEVDHVIQSLPKEFSDIDVLINNAGLALGLTPAQKAEIEDWDQMVDTNIKGVLNCTNAILPKMVAQNRGHIINIGSVAGEFPYPGGNVYGATKAFVHQFSLNLRADLLGTAVRVTNVEPGLAGDTEFSLTRFKGDKKKADAVYAGAEFITSEDIADTVSWIMSRPAHLNINVISLMPTGQAFGPFAIHRK
jgi:3-hydroxy acid dehydrogenase / malonic semialdehyde reductase